MTYEQFLDYHYEYRNFQSSLHSAQSSLHQLEGMDLPNEISKEVSTILNNIRALENSRRRLAYKTRQIREEFIIGGGNG